MFDTRLTKDHSPSAKGVRARVNYLYPSDDRIAIYIDKDGIAGNIVMPDYDEQIVQIRDERSITEPVSFKTDALEFIHAPTSASGFEDGDTWQDKYEAEIASLLKDRLGANEVLIFDHTIRVDDPNETRRPARHVHSDYSVKGAHQRLRDLVGEDAAPDWEAGHFAFVNTWRPIDYPIESTPLGFIRPRSVQDSEWRDIDLVYPDRVGQIKGLIGNKAHEWVYLSDMTPDEIAFLNIYDNRGLAQIAHSALDLIDQPAPTRPRKSLETRTLIRY